MKLWTYVRKKVMIETIDGQQFTGKVTSYDDEIDSDRGEDFIYLDVGMTVLFGFYESQIKSIEVLD